MRDFRYLAPAAHRRRCGCIRVDLPGFGGQRARAAEAVARLAGRPRAGPGALADPCGLPRFGVLGHSMGGGTALVAAAARSPRRVRRLVLVSSLALSPHRGLGSPAALRPGRSGWRLPGLRRLLLPLVRAAYRRRRFPRRRPDGRRRDFALQLPGSPPSTSRCMRRVVAGPLPPTLMAYARDDHMVETWVSEELAAALPGARVLAFDAGGHNLQKTRRRAGGGDQGVPFPRCPAPPALP